MSEASDREAVIEGRASAHDGPPTGFMDVPDEWMANGFVVHHAYYGLKIGQVGGSIRLFGYVDHPDWQGGNNTVLNVPIERFGGGAYIAQQIIEDNNPSERFSAGAGQGTVFLNVPAGVSGALALEVNLNWPLDTSGDS